MTPFQTFLVFRDFETKKIANAGRELTDMKLDNPCKKQKKNVILILFKLDYLISDWS
jgi:hypothetical protein